MEPNKANWPTDQTADHWPLARQLHCSPAGNEPEQKEFASSACSLLVLCLAQTAAESFGATVGRLSACASVCLCVWQAHFFSRPTLQPPVAPHFSSQTVGGERPTSGSCGAAWDTRTQVIRGPPMPVGSRRASCSIGVSFSLFGLPFRQFDSISTQAACPQLPASGPTLRSASLASIWAPKSCQRCAVVQESVQKSTQKSGAKVGGQQKASARKWSIYRGLF